MPLSELRCPECLRVLVYARGIGHDHQPASGDFTMCSGCGAILRFGLFGFTRSNVDELRKHAHPLSVEVMLKCREQILARPRN
jgi:hypothetical protein